MLRQEKMGGADALLKLSVAIDDDLKVLQPYLMNFDGQNRYSV